jgi:Zn-dependent peptidase ImmA (M78 family)
VKDLDRAVEWAASAHRRVGTAIPIDVATACHIVKLRVRSKRLHEDSDGYLLRTPKYWYAVINTDRPQERQRWTLAHELCEYLIARQYHDSEAGPRTIMRACGTAQERLCDRFAAELLMPADQVRAQANEVHHSARNDKTNVLASRFGVSETAMRIRLREIGVEPKKGKGVRL